MKTGLTRALGEIEGEYLRKNLWTSLREFGKLRN